jgi:hypothetical protein
MFRSNKRFEISTPNGFQPFKGIQKLIKPTHNHIIFEDGGEIRVSEDHPFGENKVKPALLKVGDVLDGRVITYNEVVEETINLYDLIEVGGGNLYYGDGIIHHNCDFVGSAGTLINPSKLKSLVYDDPIESSGGLDVYERPVQGHEYLMTVDVSRGMKLDYSAFLLVDITSYPHRLVAKYRNNTIKPMLFPDIIVQVANQYNKAWILCEVNDIGDQVASIIFYDMEYENLLMTSMRGRAGQVLGHGFSGGKTQLGLKMAKAPKKLGTSNLKQMVESDKILFKDFQIINELTTFVEKRSSFEAEEGCNDDLVMCLVIYAWAVAQSYFKEMTDQSIRQELYEKDKESLESDMSPFGFIQDGALEEKTVDTDGNVWTNVDEYGTPAGNWQWGTPNTAWW